MAQAFWAEVRSLVEDGVAFTRARATGAPPNGASAGGGGGGYEAVGDGGKGGAEKGGGQKAKAVPSDLFVGVDEAEQAEEQEEEDEDVVE